MDFAAPVVAVVFAVPAAVVALLVAVVGVDFVEAGGTAFLVPIGVFGFAAAVLGVVPACLFVPEAATFWMFATPACKASFCFFRSLRADMVVLFAHGVPMKSD